MDKIIKKYCPTCADYKDCPYRLRNLESKCSQLSDVAYGYELAEQDMKEWFIQFVHRHYPLNYIGWIKDFKRAWEENNG